ncbi:MAG: KilA-N domain-containing protein [Richelia sp. SM1_7_0]|nr:KilA-N domain-containing protein [Richelia sp. SM1_7_0]
MTLSILNWNDTAITATTASTQIHTYQVPQGYINATQMCTANGKQLKHWNENKRVKAFIEVLSTSLGITIDLLIIQITDGANDIRGTWVHPRIAINIGQWISPEFDVWVSGEIEKIINRKVEPAPQPQLPPDERLSKLVDCLQFLDIQVQNPRYKQALQDIALDVLGVNSAPQLPQTIEVWRGVVEIAELMGYQQAKDLSTRSKLGKYVSRFADELERRQEKRLCNGTQRLCWIYLDGDRIREVIGSFFQ